MAKKPSNLFAGLSNSKTRTFVIIFGVIIAIGVAIAIMRGKDTGEDILSKQTSQVLAVPTDIKATPGGSTTEKQRELLMKENERRAQEALQTKSSAIPTIVGAMANPADKNAADAAALDAIAKGEQRNKIGRLGLGDAGMGGLEGGGAFGAAGPGGAGTGTAGTGSPFGSGDGGPFGKSTQDRARELQEQRLREQREQLEKQRAEQERLKELERQRRLAEQQQKEYEASVQKTAGQMKTYATSAYNEWAKIPVQSYVKGVLADKEFKRVSEVEVVTTTKTLTRSGVSPSAARLGNVRPAHKKVFIKAGTVLFGVLDTAVNTDEPGPVLATVVSGKYNGGRLIGTFTHQAQQTSLTINFNQMTLPKKAKSFGVSAVAIDPDTARTALATDYDRHLLQRYGMLFAASFIQGYGQAIAQQGSTTTTSPLTGTTTSTYPELDNRQIFFVALGELGKQTSQAIKPYFNTPYTVTVDQGTSVGLLFLSDVDVSDEE
ncbi:MAG: hypothetical protein JSS07_03325 [Proteobacteria bacterium]|nr:hypothetical protein [Pseudomonadota bacterium]